MSMKGERKFAIPLPGIFPIFRPVISGTEPVHRVKLAVIILISSTAARSKIMSNKYWAALQHSRSLIPMLSLWTLFYLRSANEAVIRGLLVP